MWLVSDHVYLNCCLLMWEKTHTYEKLEMLWENKTKVVDEADCENGMYILGGKKVSK